VEPWEIGIRKAKEFLFTGDTIDAQEAWRLGLVNRVVPRDELTAKVRELADRVALVPPVTAQTVKDTINHTADLMASETPSSTTSWRTTGSTTRPRPWTPWRRAGEGVDAGRHGRAGQGRHGTGHMTDPTPGPLSGIRVVDVGTRISAPFCAGLLASSGPT